MYFNPYDTSSPYSSMARPSSSLGVSQGRASRTTESRRVSSSSRGFSGGLRMSSQGPPNYLTQAQKQHQREGEASEETRKRYDLYQSLRAKKYGEEFVRGPITYQQGRRL